MTGKYFDGVDSKLEAAILTDNRAAIAEALKAGANVNARGIHNITPLMMAVDRLKHNAVAELLAQGANPNLKADDGAGAVSLAVENYREAPNIMFAIFQGGGNPDTRRPDNDPVIIRFLNDRNCEFIRHMKALGADLNITTRGDDPLITDASTARDWDVVWCLIELGARYDHEQTSRRPLSISLAAKTPSPDSPIYPYKKKVWQFLKDHGVAVQPLKE
jgi:ankyrin repeat protein